MMCCCWFPKWISLVMSIPHFIYFDLGRVILDFDYHLAYHQLADVTGLSSKRIQEILGTDRLQVRYEEGILTSHEFHELFCQQCGSRPDYALFLQAGSSIFRPNVLILPVITQLAAANYPLGILSNTCEAHWEYCTGQYGILRSAFDIHVLSYRVKAMKPNEKIYEAATEMAGCSAVNIFFVDDLVENVEGARRFGMDAVQYTSVPQLVHELKSRGLRFNY